MKEGAVLTMTRNLPILLDMLIKDIIAKIHKYISHTMTTNTYTMGK